MNEKALAPNVRLVSKNPSGRIVRSCALSGSVVIRESHCLERSCAIVPDERLPSRSEQGPALLRKNERCYVIELKHPVLRMPEELRRRPYSVCAQ